MRGKYTEVNITLASIDRIAIPGINRKITSNARFNQAYHIRLDPDRYDTIR